MLLPAALLLIALVAFVANTSLLRLAASMPDVVGPLSNGNYREDVATGGKSRPESGRLSSALRPQHGAQQQAGAPDPDHQRAAPALGSPDVQQQPLDRLVPVHQARSGKDPTPPGPLLPVREEGRQGPRAEELLPVRSKTDEAPLKILPVHEAKRTPVEPTGPLVPVHEAREAGGPTSPPGDLLPVRSRVDEIPLTMLPVHEATSGPIEVHGPLIPVHEAREDNAPVTPPGELVPVRSRVDETTLEKVPVHEARGRVGPPGPPIPVHEARGRDAGDRSRSEGADPSASQTDSTGIGRMLPVKSRSESVAPPTAVDAAHGGKSGSADLLGPLVPVREAVSPRDASSALAAPPGPLVPVHEAVQQPTTQGSLGPILPVREAPLQRGECKPLRSGMWPPPRSMQSSGAGIAVVDGSALLVDIDRGGAITVDGVDIVRAAFNRLLDRLPKGDAETLVEPDPAAGALLSLSVVLHDGVGDTSVAGADVPAGGNEAYELTVDAAQNGAFHARLVGASAWGALHGITALEQLMAVDRTCRVSIPNVPLHIEDAPERPHRALMIDVSRNFFPLETLERAIVGMAAAKMNALHLHLTDDAAFALRLDDHPQLAEQGGIGMTHFFWEGMNVSDPSSRGAFRGIPLNGDGKGAGAKYYTSSDIRQLIAFGRARGVRVIPELDMPGHAFSWHAGAPELALTATCPEYDHDHFGGWGHPLNVASPHLRSFVRDVVFEVAALFDDPVIHLGGDEVGVRCWYEDGQAKAIPANRRETMLNLSPSWRVFEERLWDDIVEPLSTGVGTKLPPKRFVLYEDWHVQSERAHLPAPASGVDPAEVVVVEAWSFGANAEELHETKRFRTLESPWFYLDNSGLNWRSMTVAELPAADNAIGGVVKAWEMSPAEFERLAWVRLSAAAARLWSTDGSRGDLEAVGAALEVHMSRVKEFFGLGYEDAELRSEDEAKAVYDPISGPNSEFRQWLAAKVAAGLVGDAYEYSKRID